MWEGEQSRGGCYCGSILPNRPSASSFRPALKNSVPGDDGGPDEFAAPPNVSAQSPSLTRGLPSGPDSAPSQWPVFGSNALITPSSKLPIRMSLANLPKLAGAIARPHGE